MSRLAAAVLLAAALLAACGDDEDGAAATTTTPTTADTAAEGDSVDACALVSADEITEALDAEFDDGISQVPLGGAIGQCDFVAESISDAPVGTIGVFALPAGDYDVTLQQLGAAEPLPGFEVDAAGTGAGVLVRLDAFTLLVSAVAAGGDDAAERAAEEAVARIVAANA